MAPRSPQSSSPPKDPYAQQGKALASQVQRLRGWISTDPARLPELVDALNALVAHRLDGHLYGAAGADAQDAVKQSADLLLSSGPLGPYSSAADVLRCGTALVQLAALQAGIGLVDAAGATLGSWDGVRAQVAEAGTRVDLDAGAGRHALLVAARVALAAGNPGAANAYADAALGVVGEPPSPSGFVAVDLERVASDARWAAGHAEQALGFLHEAKEAYERVAGDRLAEPGRLSAGVAERLAEPLPGLYRDLADRLGAVGERDLALANRRLLVQRLRALAGRSETFRAALAVALTDLSADLLEADRSEEAVDAANDAQGVAAERGVPASARLLAAAAAARASLRSGHPAPAGPLRGLLTSEGEEAGPAVRRVVSAVLAETLRAEGLDEAAVAAEAEATAGSGTVPVDEARGVVARGDGTATWAPLEPGRAYGAPVAPTTAAGAPATPTWLEQERAEARRQESERADQARREAEERAAAEAQAAEAERAAADLRAAVQAQEQQRAEARRQAVEEAEQAERKRRREERLRQHQAEVEEREREQRAVRRAEIDTRLAELDAAEEPERDRLLAERATLDEADAAPARVADVEPAPVVEPEPEATPEPEPAQEPEPQPEPEPEPEPHPEPEPESEPEPSAPDDLVVAERALAAARADGGRREVRAAAEAVVVLLRARAEQDPAAWTTRLRAALEDLSSARLRSGDLFGARSASREARALR